MPRNLHAALIECVLPRAVTCHRKLLPVTGSCCLLHAVVGLEPSILESRKAACVVHVMLFCNCVRVRLQNFLSISHTSLGTITFVAFLHLCSTNPQACQWLAIQRRRTMPSRTCINRLTRRNIRFACYSQVRQKGQLQTIVSSSLTTRRLHHMQPCRIRGEMRTVLKPSS